MKNHHVVSLFLLSWAASGCAFDASPDPLALDDDVDPASPSDLAQEKSPEFFYDPTSVMGSVVPVCWYSDTHLTEKTWVRNAVERAFEPYTGIDFTGWGTCSNGSIQISVGNHQWPRSHVGDQAWSFGATMFLNFFEGPPQDVPHGGIYDGITDFDHCWSGHPAGAAPTTGDSNTRTWSTGRQRCIEVIAVHEFLHAMAVFHEQESPLNNTSFCASPSGHGTSYGFWDLVSNSNYCNPVWNGDGMLSPLDLSGLSMLYGTNDPQNQMWYGIGNVRDYRGAPADGFLFRMTSYSIGGGFNPFVGDFNGDARSDIFWYAPGAGQDSVYFANTGGNGFQTRYVTMATSTVPAVADFDGDGRDDIVWHTPGSGANLFWFGRSDKFFDTLTGASMPGGYKHKPYAGDFDGDGRGDIYWYGQNSNAEQIWFGRADRSFDVVSASQSGGASPIVGDFDGDGRSDIYFYTPGTAADSLAYGSASRGVFSSHNVAMDETAVPTVSDLDGNGVSDLLWSTPTESDLIWLFSSTRGTFTTAPTSSILGNSQGDAKPLGGDYNGDGMGDVFWYTR